MAASSVGRRSSSSGRSLHDAFGGGFVADVILWRKRDVSVGILGVMASAWLLFERSHYTPLSLASQVLLCLFTILFIWAKSAAILSRPPPPLPELHLTEEMVEAAAAFVRSQMNFLLSICQDIALGKDSKLFFKVAAYLWLISFVSSLVDIVSLIYAGLIIVLTVPALYEKYEQHVDAVSRVVYHDLHILYEELDSRFFSQISGRVGEKRKLD